ncbi:hypothetical protein C8R43DRAFT_26580 [Mycena crocata]|nr:hypothetical protein C8R43DRAFT_26580 [Mycena crocata]
MLVQIVALFALAVSSTAVPVQEAANSLGYLKCTSSGRVIGYIARTLNSAGEYEGVSPSSDSNDVNHRMLVSLDQSVNGTQSFLVKNAPDNEYPFLGAIGGVDGDTLGTNSSNYLLVGGTRTTKSGDAPFYCGNTFTDSTNKLRKCASAVWVYDAATSKVTPHWTNSDGTTVDAFVGYVDAAFILTGSTEAFEKEFDEEEVEWLTLSLDA